MKITIVSDAWSPQVNGVVTTLKNTCDKLIALGHDIDVIKPLDFHTVLCPGYGEIRLSLFARKKVYQRLRSFQPGAIHIATEGPLGRLARSYCRRHNLPFTTAYHTQFPEYLKLRLGIPESWSYAYLRRFHNKATGTMVSTSKQRAALNEQGFTNLLPWGRGVDSDLFKPTGLPKISLPGPVAVYVGRISVEKNLTALLEMKAPKSILVVGDGPDLQKLKRAYTQIHFVGYQFGEDLVGYLKSGDVFVFPSRTDTFGLVMIEAMACGIPVAAFPVTGPIDVVADGKSGCLHDDLDRAFEQALMLNQADVLAHAQRFSWRAATLQFLKNLTPIDYERDVTSWTANIDPPQ